jgi:hypothetical protein
VLYSGALDSCSPFTWDASSFFSSAVTGGSVGRPEAKDQDELLFAKQCLAKLPKKYKDDNTVTYTNQRIVVFSDRFYDWDFPCSGFDRIPEQDPMVSQGLHCYIIYMSDLASVIAQAPEKRLLRTNREYIAYNQHDQDEWDLGLLKSTLVYQSEALVAIELTTTYVIILFILILVIVLAQYLFLGRRIEGLMQEHTGMSGIVNRFKEEEAQIAQLREMKTNDPQGSTHTAATRRQHNNSEDGGDSNDLEGDSGLDDSEPEGDASSDDDSLN